MADLHNALRTEVMDRAASGGVEVLLVQLQHRRDQVSHSLHVRSSSFTSYGIQMTDLLAILGFQRSHCVFVNGECYAKEADASFDVHSFAATLEPMRRAVFEAQQHFEKCGFLIHQPEGWGYYFGRSSGSLRGNSRHGGDGHTGQTVERMKEAEDEAFKFVFTWVVGDRQKGWTTHYRPIHPPLSPEVASIFRFLRLQDFESCPEFDFEGCHWRFTPYEARGERDFFNRPADRAHAWFDAHQEHFSAGVERLLAAEQQASRFEFRLLPAAAGTGVAATPLRDRQPASKEEKPGGEAYEFDVAISFAGTERELAEQLAQLVRDAGFQVFYDLFYPEHLWGKDLVELFDRIYRKSSRFCVMFLSQEYRERLWTTHERRSALARALEEKGQEYLLPLEVESVEIEGLRPTIGRLSIKEHSIKEIAEILIRKIRGG